MKNNYSKIFALIKQINSTGAELNHKQIVEDFTGRAGASLKELNTFQIRQIESNLIALLNKPKTDFSADPLNNTRRAIIAQFKAIGKDTLAAIAWAEKYGVKGVKKKFNDYEGQELHTLLKNAERMRKQFFERINKKSNAVQPTEPVKEN